MTSPTTESTSFACAYLRISETWAASKGLTRTPSHDPEPSEPCIHAGVFEDDPTLIYIPSLQASDRYDMAVEIQEIDRKVEQVWLDSTKRLGADREMLNDLVAKYGKPTSISRDSETHAELAAWEFDGLEVLWSSRNLSRDHGRAIVQTARGMQYAAEQLRKREAETPRL
jgi:hypothetical protein